MSPITRVNLTRHGNDEFINIHCDTPGELEKLPPVLSELLKKSEVDLPISTPDLSAKAKEVMVTEPIRLVFRVLGGLTLAFFVYWFGFK